MRPGICQGRRSGVALLDLNTDALEQVKSELEREAGQERHGCQVLVYQVNVADKTAVTTAVESAAGVFGRLDYVVNSAGISFKHEGGSADWHRVLDANLNGTFYVYRAAA